jgi:hypothetical protein
MSEKHLTESPWKVLAAKFKLKDLGLQSVLHDYASINPETDPDAASHALVDIGERSAKLKKANPTLKEISAYLDEISKEVARQRQSLAAISKARTEQEDPADDQLKPRLIASLNKVHAAAGKDSIPFVACVAKPFYGVLLAKSPTETIGPAHKKILAALTGGTKFIVGKCLFENNAHTFVVDNVPSGLAKNLKTSLKEFTGQTYKVRVRDPEGKVVGDADSDTGGDENTPTVPATQETPRVPSSSTPPAAEVSAQFTARFKSLQPDMLKAIATKSPQADEVKKRATEAGAFAAKKDFEQANRTLDQVEALLNKTSAGPGPSPAKGEANRMAATKPEDQPKDSPPPAQDNKELEAVKAEIQATQQLIDDLKKNVQNGKITAEITAAETQLTKAKGFVDTGKFKEARAAIAAAKLSVTSGKQTADKYAEYATKRAAAAVLIASLNGAVNKDYLDKMNDQLTAADALVAAPSHDFAKGISAVEKVRQELVALFKTWYVDNPKKQIKQLKAGAAAAFIAGDIKEIESLQADIQSDLNGEAWRKVRLEGTRLADLIGIASRVSDRRQAFDSQRAATRRAIDGLKNRPALATQMAAMEKQLADADGMASRQSMFIEAGATKLKEIQANCGKLLSQAGDADAYLKQRKAADQKMAALSGHPAVASLGQVLPGIQHELQQAAQLAAEGPAQDWKAARAVIDQVMEDLTAAAKLADKAKDLQETASNAADASAIKKALVKLRNEAKNLSKGDAAQSAQTELARIKTALDSAEKETGEGHPDKAPALLKTAADLIAAVQLIQQQHSRLGQLRKTLDQRRNALLKLPTATSNKPKIDAIEKALTDADAQEKARAWDKLTEALGAAQEAANQAEQAARSRKDFDVRAKAVADQLKVELKRGGVNEAEGKAIQADLTAGIGQADKFTFDAANQSIDSAESRFEASSVNKLARLTPPNAKLLASSARKMMAKGGAKLLDSIVKQLPDNTSFAALAPLAKERFGLELKSDEGDATASAKKIWEMLAKVPEDVIGNPSLKKIERQEPTKNGGLYDSGEEMVVMNGRPGQHEQGFGDDIANELPANVEDDCKPVDDKKVDYFDFATLHEVGHSVDENVQFMQSRVGQDAFGGWRSYGGKVEPIAAAVAKWAGYDSAPEQKKYVLDLILENQPSAPTTTPDKQADWDDALKKVTDWHKLATNEKIWWHQDDCNKITIDGTIYHEAYKGIWVSYVAKARTQAITGYQFRAPGEWFAELYASYRIGKLKPSHPAVKWLSAIKL